MSEIAAKPVASSPERDVQRHPLIIRVAHWLLALSIIVMILSGWRIYNASPIFPFSFPVAITLGGDVAEALARHNDPGSRHGDRLAPGGDLAASSPASRCICSTA